MINELIAPITTTSCESTAAEQCVLSIDRLSLYVRGARWKSRVVDNITLQIRKGEFYALVGESGSGKSLIAKSIMRLLPEALLEIDGSIQLDGEELSRASAQRMTMLRGRSVSMIFQEPMTSLNPLVRVGKQIAEAMGASKGQSTSDRHAKVLELLGSVRFKDPASTAHAYPHELSGGMRQRIMIAMALANNPSLLIADEPTTALDVTIQQEVMEIIAGLQRAKNLAVLFISHDLSLVSKYSDRIGILYGGVLMEQGVTDSVIGAPRHPYTDALLRCVPRLRQAGERQSGIKGSVPSISDWPTGCRYAPRCQHRIDDCLEDPIHLYSDQSERLIRCNHPLPR